MPYGTFFLQIIILHPIQKTNPCSGEQINGPILVLKIIEKTNQIYYLWGVSTYKAEVKDRFTLIDYSLIPSESILFQTNEGN